MEDSIADLPPAKRRRTLAGSIVSTAVNAALIGTAVGLTMYRLVVDGWGKERLEGEEERSSPPPPYHQGDYRAGAEGAGRPHHIEVTPAMPRARNGGKARQVQHHLTSPRRTGVRQRRMRPLGQRFSPARSTSPAAHEGVEGGDAELDEMDWIGDRLSRLIEEGQKALNREIVVMSDAKEDEEDDGSGGWEEEGGQSSLCGVSQRRGVRAREDVGVGVGVGSSSTSAAVSSVREDESAWGSPTLRESMARARARARARAKAGTSGSGRIL